MPIKYSQSQHISTDTVGGIPISVVDEHQYAILFWAKQALSTKRAYTLISIDYHPDTNPPFWMRSYQKAMAIDPKREADLVETFSQQYMDKIQANNLDTLSKIMPMMNNDEQINTAMTLGYLKDYHMINAMEEHHYTTGTHYLVPEQWVGRLDDNMFNAVGFSQTIVEEPYILDIDLDYFNTLNRMKLDLDVNSVFAELVRNATCITVARSYKYFNYLRHDKQFTLSACEAAFLQLLHTIC